MDNRYNLFGSDSTGRRVQSKHFIRNILILIKRLDLSTMLQYILCPTTLSLITINIIVSRHLNLCSILYRIRPLSVRQSKNCNAAPDH